VLGEGLSDLKQRLLQRADVVISVSEATKRGILEYFDIDEAKIKVVPLGNYFEKPSLSGLEVLSLPERYVLFVGKRDFYKNFKRFFEAISPILLKDKDLHLVCAGGGDFENEEIQAISSRKLQSQVWYQPIFDDTTLIQLYQKAQLFVFPSLMEGFGLPILEAMSCGCPVAVTTGTSFDEIAEEAAVYFEAEQVDSIKAAVERVVYNDGLRSLMQAKGYERIPLFKSETTAQKTSEVYKELVNV
jgi:glycosyltransferase involved in cell wall biosynthesis